MIISLPIKDRPRSYAFYQEAFGLEPTGEPDDDGIPEPLRFVLSDDVHLMLIPIGGFKWVLGSQRRAPRNTSECILSLPLPDEAAVDKAFARATTAGATPVTPPTRKDWGYIATLTDPDGHLWMLETATFWGGRS
ncbi:hypothetical protein EV646_110309 [Kribbella antiqua]|uniref:VOC domain-containing protein n=1 Tax=Kribbella antiqua TaxID=2512217 RepID=A0A4R2II76_9ACTN|nr:VOC family protein [Kribbella antiqua]TCO44594.1 hypothetical protein EV646_110309 [Kribbella antiqua]